MANPLDPNKYPIGMSTPVGGMSKAPVLPTPTGAPITKPVVATTPVKPLSQMTVAEAQASGQGDAYNKLVGSYSTPTVSPNIITPSNLTTPNTNPLPKTPVPATSPALNDLASRTNANATTTANQTVPEKSTYEKVAESAGFTAPESQAKAYTDMYGVQTTPEELNRKKAEATRITNEITQFDKDFRDRVAEIRKNPEGKLRGALEAEVRQAQSEYDDQRANKMIQYNVSLGDYTAAKEGVDALFQIKSKDIENDYNYRKGLVAGIYDDLTAKEKAQADLVNTKNAQDFQLKRDDLAYQKDVKLKNLTGVTGNGLYTDAGKPLNDTQNTAYGYANRLVEAGNIINSIGGNFTGASSYVGQNLPNIAKSAERQSYEQAQRNFVNAVLRKESGAVISPQEFASAQRQYFPQPGDSEKVVQQKTANRNTVINNLYRSAGVSGQKSQEVVTRPEDLRAKYAY